VAVPLPTPVTFPNTTVATAVSVVDHTIPPEEPVAVSCTLPPTLRCTVLGLTESVDEEEVVPGGEKSEQPAKAPTIPAAAIATTRPA
ncbi:MAG TPA: hypothetical protein VH539_11875, partial [Gemmatimonadaceae bacterium]